MTLEELARHLGGLESNFQSLEFVLRLFLQKCPSARPCGVPYGTDIYSYPVGAELPENEVTSYDTLGQPIDKYNGEFGKMGLPSIDRTMRVYRPHRAKNGRFSCTSSTGSPFAFLV
jgi:hypothetical protein